MSKSFRKKLNDNPQAVAATVAVLVIVAVTVVVWQVVSSRRTFTIDAPPGFFTVDDGQTWFVAGTGNVPPFEHEGQTAVRAHVFECNGREFVGYLERYKPEARAVVAEQEAKRHTANPDNPSPFPTNMGAMMAAEINGRELKRPGDAEWVSSDDFAKAAAVTKVLCPENASGTAEPLVP